MQFEIVTKKELVEELEKAAKSMVLDVVRLLLPKKLTTNQAANLVGITDEAMRTRKSKGYYIDGIHYFSKKDDKLTAWDRDALLQEVGAKLK